MTMDAATQTEPDAVTNKEETRARRHFAAPDVVTYSYTQVSQEQQLVSQLDNTVYVATYITDVQVKRGQLIAEEMGAQTVNLCDAGGGQMSKRSQPVEVAPAVGAQQAAKQSGGLQEPYVDAMLQEQQLDLFDAGGAQMIKRRQPDEGNPAVGAQQADNKTDGLQEAYEDAMLQEQHLGFQQHGARRLDKPKSRNKSKKDTMHTGDIHAVPAQLPAGQVDAQTLKADRVKAGQQVRDEDMETQPQQFVHVVYQEDHVGNMGPLPGDQSMKALLKYHEREYETTHVDQTAGAHQEAYSLACDHQETAASFEEEDDAALENFEAISSQMPTSSELVTQLDYPRGPRFDELLEKVVVGVEAVEQFVRQLTQALGQDTYERAKDLEVEASMALREVQKTFNSLRAADFDAGTVVCLYELKDRIVAAKRKFTQVQIWVLRAGPSGPRGCLHGT